MNNDIKQSERLQMFELTDFSQRAIYAIIKQLRELTFDEFLERANQQRNAGYTIVGAFLGEKLVGVIGMRPVCTLARSRYLHVDDLVVDIEWRGRGVGRDLLYFAEEWARHHSLRSVFLDSRPEVEGFYKKLGYSPHTAILLRKKIDSIT